VALRSGCCQVQRMVNDHPLHHIRGDAEDAKGSAKGRTLRQARTHFAGCQLR
jgi:hypothetical protein